MSNEMMLSVSKNIKRIKVNEAGEYITLNFDDQSLLPRLVDLMKEFEAVADEYTIKSAEIGTMPEDTQRERIAKISTEAKFTMEICTQLKQKVDAAFHDEVCRKVFGDITPSVSAFAEFFDQLGGLLRKFAAERDEEFKRKTAKYTEKYNRG